MIVNLTKLTKKDLELCLESLDTYEFETIMNEQSKNSLLIKKSITFHLGLAIRQKLNNYSATGKYKLKMKLHEAVILEQAFFCYQKAYPMKDQKLYERTLINNMIQIINPQML